MAIARIKTWVAGEVLTASDLNGEFNNIIIYLNALSFNTLIGDGTVTAPAIAFAFDTDTGFYRISGGGVGGANGLGLAVNGATVFVASEFFQASAFLFPVKTATEAVRTAMPGRAYWQATEGGLHIHTGTLIARIPAITGLQAGDLIEAVNASGGNSGATTYARVQRPPTELSRLVFETSTKLNLASGYIPLKVGGAWVRRNLHAAVELLAPTVTSNTLYYIYAFDSEGVTTLEASTTVHVAATQHGVRVKSGDESRTLVGAAFAGTAGAFADSATARMTGSWFSRPGKVLRVTTATAYQTSSVAYIEIDPTLRGQFFTWGEDVEALFGGGDIRNDTAGAFIFIAIGAGRGTTLNQPCDGAGGGQSDSAGARFFFIANAATTFAEGTGYFSPLYRVNAGNGVYVGSSSPERGILHARLNI